MTVETDARYEAVIGLEVHCELSTVTKLFCGCPNEFGAEPNTNICPVCLGLPGSLPVLNERAVEFALRLAEALDFDVPATSIFARKNYFYPDMPKDYQVSQYEEPILVDGRLDVDGATIGIERAHLEEDTGKTVHVGGGGRIHEADHSLVDYNRAGVPLMEIVSRPEITSAEQARAYVDELRSVLGDHRRLRREDGRGVDARRRERVAAPRRHLGARDQGRDQEHELAAIARSGHRLRDRAPERTRSTPVSASCRRRATGTKPTGARTACGRRKGSSDYRYFPEPDLVPVAPTDEQRSAVRGALPELPAARRARLVEDWGIGESDARVLLGEPGLADYADAAVAALDGGTARDVANWCAGDVLAYLNESGLSPEVLPLPPDGLAELVGLVADGTLSRNLAKDVLDEALREPKRPKQIVEERGLAQVSDEGELGSVIDEIIAAHPDVVEEYRSGDDKAKKKKRGFLMGEAMKAMRGQGNPQLLNRLLDDRLG